MKVTEQNKTEIVLVSFICLQKNTCYAYNKYWDWLQHLSIKKLNHWRLRNRFLCLWVKTRLTYSLSQRIPAVPSGQVQVLCGLQVAPCWQGGTQGVVTAANQEHINNENLKVLKKRQKECIRAQTCRLACFTDASTKSFRAATPIEAHAHATVPARFLTLYRFWGKRA